MKKLLSLLLSVLIVHAFSYAPLAAETPKEKAKKAQLVSAVKAGVASLGTGSKSRVRVVLTDKTKYHGYITEIAEEHFVVADAKTGTTAPITYREVAGIKGNNFSTGAKIGIGIAIAAAVGIIIAVLAGRDDDRDESCTRTAQIGVPCPPGCVCIQQ
jgi:hypothetical protein